MKSDTRKRIGVLAVAFSMLTVGMVLTISDMSMGANGDIQATRSITPDSVEPGDTFTVNVVVQANADVTAPALDEDVPAGWTVTPVSNPGWTFKASTLEWVYMGGLTTGQTSTIVYDVTVPAGAAEMTYSLSGQVSAFGAGPFVVTGETDVVVETAAVPNNPPTVAITSPADGATVSGTVAITGTASDTDGTVTSVQIRGNGGTWTTVTGTTSWSFNWDSTSVSDGSFTIDARSYDGTDYSALDSVTVTVDNVPAPTEDIVGMRSIDPDTVAPGGTFQVQVVVEAGADITAPALDEDVPAGWTVTPVTTPAGWTFKASSLEWIYAGAMSTGQTATIVYDVTVPAGAAEMTYSLLGQVSAFGVGPFVVTGETDVTVSGAPPENDPPTVDITAPVNGATVSGTVTVQGTAADTDGTVQSVEVRIDGGSWMTATGTTSWTYSWDTTGVTDGGHTVSARSYDGTDYSALDSVTVTVDNVPAPTEDIVGMRSIDPDTVAPGGTFQVQVVVEAGADITAPALDEDVPAGWTVTPVTTPAGWTFKASSLEWIYAGAMSTGQTATIVYDVTVPAGAAEMTYSLSGQVSAFGVGPFVVTGETDVTVSGGPANFLVGTRSINPDSVAPGDTFTVQVLVEANADVTAPALDEDVPAGWTVTPVTTPAGWTFKPSTLEWVYAGAMSTGETATIVYDVTIPAGAVETTYSLSGQVSAYLVGPFAVTGETDVKVGIITGDINDDGHVNVLDMILVGNHWGETGDPGWIPEDLNEDGIINEGDMVVIGQNWTG
ncbi:MAG: Ig-like domain-containing protein [Candidatus Thermoplasmatota archaeon]|nr:Ig-like domain-containing protein [Candidatus Thermoplasmatota archaeon]